VCRCDERLKAKAERYTRLAYTGSRGELEHLKIETRLIDERFCAGAVTFTIVKRSRRICCRKDKGLVAKKTHEPVYMRERGA